MRLMLVLSLFLGFSASAATVELNCVPVGFDGLKNSVAIRGTLEIAADNSVTGTLNLTLKRQGRAAQPVTINGVAFRGALETTPVEDTGKGEPGEYRTIRGNESSDPRVRYVLLNIGYAPKASFDSWINTDVTRFYARCSL